MKKKNGINNKSQYMKNDVHHVTSSGFQNAPHTRSAQWRDRDSRVGKEAMHGQKCTMINNYIKYIKITLLSFLIIVLSRFNIGLYLV